jgi:DNA replication protein DnaC
MQKLGQTVQELASSEQPLKQSNQEKLKILDHSSFELAKSIFWKYARKRSQKELKEEFIVDDENKATVAAFVAYFTGNKEAMSQHNVDYRKGIIIFGNPGSGKSILFRILRDCLESDKVVQVEEREVKERQFFQKTSFLTCEHMAKLYMAKGEVELHKFGQKAVVNINGDTHCHHACFDDLGAEEVRNNYGNIKEVMVDLINERYDLFLQYGLKTHFTTNLNPDQIEKRYSTRVRSRLKQMCNVLALGTNEEYLDRR